MLKLFKTFLKSTVVGATSILLLSPLAEATSLRYESGEGSKVVGIDGLEVLGKTYNVDFFSFRSYDSVYANSTPVFLNDEEGGKAAVVAIASALGTEEFTFETGEGRFDSVLIPFQISIQPVWMEVFWDNEDLGIDSPNPNSALNGLAHMEWAFALPWAKFEQVEVAVSSKQSTPEPSLILGFITLGGVMLGSRKKEKA